MDNKTQEHTEDGTKSHEKVEPDRNFSEAETLIKVRDLVAHYGDKKILDGISMDIKAGEIMVIMGGSGSGKSTLLNHLLGLLTPTSGSVELLGEHMGELSEKALTALRKKIGVAFQGGALLSSMTVGENVSLPLREHTKLDRETINIMLRMKLEAVDLHDSEFLMPAELSGGMLKRAALARAIVMDPKVLFCDEPSAGLDPVISAEIDELILKLREALDMTVVVVTHELESAFTIADRICYLDKGKIAQVGTPEEIKSSTNERVQNMINRNTQKEEINPEEYIERLTAE